MTASLFPWLDEPDAPKTIAEQRKEAREADRRQQARGTSNQAGEGNRSSTGEPKRPTAPRNRPGADLDAQLVDLSWVPEGYSALYPTEHEVILDLLTGAPSRDNPSPHGLGGDLLPLLVVGRACDGSAWCVSRGSRPVAAAPGAGVAPFSVAELAALGAAIDSERVWPEDFATWCARKRRNPTWALDVVTAWGCGRTLAPVARSYQGHGVPLREVARAIAGRIDAVLVAPDQAPAPKF